MKTNTIKRSDDSSFVITRKKKNKKYKYFDEEGNRVKNKALLKRIESLVIPPMWSEVQICKWDDGHIQAIGRDLKNRKQYIYHSLWEKKQQEKKFAKLAKFGKKLPKIRKEIEKDLKIKKWKRRKLMALLVSLLDETGIRIGNQQYVARNSTYGLTTLRRKHLNIKGSKLLFEYKGKSNKIRKVELSDKKLNKLIRKCATLPGYELFRYRDQNGKFRNVDSENVNKYIHNYMGKRFSSKDFRTWVASRIAIELYPEAIQRKEDAPKKKFNNILLRMVADELGNTPTVCKNYYVHPKIMQLIDQQSLPKISKFKKDKHGYGLSSSEKLLLKVIS